MKRILLVAMIAGLTACGGDSDSAVVAPAPTTLSGVASKGLILNGQVFVDEMKSDGTVLRALGSAFTSATTGAYDFTLPGTYGGGPIRLSVRPRTAGGVTHMVCDVAGGCGATAYGAQMTLASTFNMQAILPTAAAGTNVRAAITPFTHMAVARALDNTTLDHDAVANALSEINQMVGVDVLAISPVNPNAMNSDTTEEQRVYAAFLAGVGKLARDRTTETGFDNKLNAALMALADSFEDGQLDGTDGYNATALINAVNAQATGIAGLNTETLQLITAGIAGESISGTYNPEPTPTATANVVGQAKGLVADVRTFGNSLAELETPVNTFATEMDSANTLTDDRFATLFESLNEVLTALGTEADADPDFGEIGSSVTANGYTFSIPAVSGGQTVTITIVDANSTDNLQLSATFNTGITASAWTASMGLADGSPFNLGSPNATFSGTAQTLGAVLEFTDMAATIGPLVSDGITSPQIETLSLRGTVSLTDRINDVSFSGHANLETVERAAGIPLSEGVSVNPSRVELNGEFSALRRTFTGEVSFVIHNAANVDFSTEESAANFANATVTGSFSATFPNFGTSSVAVALNRTQFEAGNVRFTISRSGRTFIVTASNDGDLPMLTIQNPAGLKLVLTRHDNMVEGNLINGATNETIATITETSDGVSIARYSDGTFESFQ